MSSKEPRENKGIMFLGPRRCGKSTFIVEEFIPAILSTKGRKDFKPVKVFQGKRNDTYSKFAGNPDVEVRRITSINDISGELGNLYNATVIFDDAQLLFSRMLDEDIRKLIINLGQVNCDVVFVFHSYTAAVKELWTLIDILEVWKVKESAKARKESLTEVQIKELDEQKDNLEYITETVTEHFTYFL